MKKQKQYELDIQETIRLGIIGWILYELLSTGKLEKIIKLAEKRMKK